MPELTLKLPAGTLEAMNMMAAVSGVAGEGKFGKLIQDALRVYEWILAQQAHERTIVALEHGDIPVLEHMTGLSGRRQMLTAFIPPDRMPTAHEFLSHVAEMKG